MKIIIAPDSFKENLTAMQVASHIEKGIKQALPRAKCIKVPMADGGEGTVQSLVDATGGSIVRKKVTGPMGEKVKARYGILGDGTTAVIEMAEASGLPLVPRARRNPLKATSYGTGELIINALDKGASRIIIGLGGSATVDGGAGMAQAIGVRFLTDKGNAITKHGNGGMLHRIADIDVSGVDDRIRNTEFIIASDVTNTLHGKHGAAHVFGPQKGATADMVKKLDTGLRHYGKVIRKTLKKDVSKLKGAGAAGGLGAGLLAFTGARMKRGVEIVVELTGLPGYLKGADLVITGEGRVDFQTAFGKTPAGVAAAARKARVPCVAIGGSLADDANGVFEHGIDGLESAAARDMDLAEALANSPRHLELAAERVIRLLLLGRKMARKRK